MKTLRQLMIFMAVTSLALWFVALPVYAQENQLLPLAPATSYNALPTAVGTTGQDKFNNLVFSIIMNVRYIIGAVAVAMIVYAGAMMALAQGKEEEYTKQRANILWSVIGLALVALSGDIIRIFSVYCDKGVDMAGNPCIAGGFLKDPNAILRSATIFGQRTQFMITFIKYLIGSIAVLMIVRSGVRMITMGTQEELATDKKNLIYSVVGLLLIILSDTAINRVFYQIDLSKYPTVGGVTPGINPTQGVNEVVGFTNVVVSILSPIAVLMLLAGGIMYMTAAGNEERQTKAKKMVIATVIGIIIMYGAFAIISSVVAGRIEGGTGPVTQTTGQ